MGWRRHVAIGAALIVAIVSACGGSDDTEGSVTTVPDNGAGDVITTFGNIPGVSDECTAIANLSVALTQAVSGSLGEVSDDILDAIPADERIRAGALMAPTLFRNLRLLDPRWDEARGGYEVLVEGDTIREVSEGPIRSDSADVVDCGGRTLMPGLIDCHAHVTLTEMNIAALEAMPVTLMTARAGVSLRAMLDRGFTTVRDTGGADWGIQKAVADGHFAGPRLFVSGCGQRPA